MSRDFFLECAYCYDTIFSYGEINEWGDYRTIQTDRGNMLVCKHHTPATVKKMWLRVPCGVKNKDGSKCSYEANNEKPYRCARHGGGKK